VFVVWNSALAGNTASVVNISGANENYFAGTSGDAMRVTVTP